MLDMATDGTAEAPAGASSTGAAAAAAAAATGAGKHAAGKIVAVRVHMLDDTVTLFQIQVRPRRLSIPVAPRTTRQN